MHTSVCSHLCVFEWVCLHAPVYMCVYMCAFVCLRACVHVCLCTSVSTCVYVYVCMHASMCVSMYVCTCVCVLLSASAYVYVHRCVHVSVCASVYMAVCAGLSPCVSARVRACGFTSSGRGPWCLTAGMRLFCLRKPRAETFPLHDQGLPWLLRTHSVPGRTRSHTGSCTLTPGPSPPDTHSGLPHAEAGGRQSPSPQASVPSRHPAPRFPENPTGAACSPLAGCPQGAPRQPGWGTGRDTPGLCVLPSCALGSPSRGSSRESKCRLQKAPGLPSAPRAYREPRHREIVPSALLILPALAMRTSFSFFFRPTVKLLAVPGAPPRGEAAQAQCLGHLGSRCLFPTPERRDGRRGQTFTRFCPC